MSRNPQDPKSAVFSLGGWLHRMRDCPDCTVLPENPEPCHPSYQSYMHEHDCGILVDVNELANHYGMRRIEGYTKKKEPT